MSVGSRTFLERVTTTTRIPGIGVTLGFLLAMISCALPSPSRAAWVNSTATQFQVGGKLAEIKIGRASCRERV